MLWFQVFSLISFTLATIQSLTPVTISYKTANTATFKPKAHKKYDLPESEKQFLNHIPEHFDWLSVVFASLMTVEDVERAYRTLHLIKAWGKYLYESNTEVNQLNIMKSNCLIVFRDCREAPRGF